MAEGSNVPLSEPLFRGNKRRKILRRRTEADDEGLPHVPTSTGNNDHEEVQQPAAPLRAARKPTTRKQGISFASNSTLKPQEHKDTEDGAVIPMHPERQQQMAQIDRFIKPTGKAAVADDKHMMAFVDSKMAEMRSATSISTTAETRHDRSNVPYGSSGTALRGRAGSEVESPVSHTSSSGTPTSKLSQADSRPQPRKRRRQAVRNASDIARDSLVDEIMREAAVPLYDKPTSSSIPVGADESGVDRDAAAAEAFKQQYIAQLEEKRKRKVAPPPGTTKGPAAKTSHGPRLGGSRAQRGKMKAMEAAEGKK